MEAIRSFFKNYIAWISIPKINLADIIEIAIIAFVLYQLINWFKTTRAWALFKGIGVLILLWMLATILEFDAIIWIFGNTIDVGIIALVIVFQPEFRRALEQLGQNSIMSPLFDTKDKSERFSDETIDGIVRATFALAKAKTGALIVIEKDVPLNEYAKSGIALDSLISSQLLINIFETNTPLHDGAVIIRGNRIVAATSYLPLSEDTGISKDLGTRHRAALGISESTDSLTIVVSEETGKVSVAVDRTLIRNVDADYLRNRLITLQNKVVEDKKPKLWKGRIKNERDTD
ncbi:MAG: TIGR00159 family protein [Clostridiales bacterium]|nr:TIGR00159 family protein [Clostridiales bacterium]